MIDYILSFNWRAIAAPAIIFTPLFLMNLGIAWEYHKITSGDDP